MNSELPRQANQAPQALSDQPARATQALIEHLPGIVAASRASSIFVYADALGGGTLPLPQALRDKVIYVTRSPAEQAAQARRCPSGARLLCVPGVPLTRMGQIKIAVFLALLRGVVRQGEIILCLSGKAGSGSLDTLVVTEVGQELEIFGSSETRQQIFSHVQPEVIERVIDIASALGREGREGKAVGSLFVVGDAGQVLAHSEQLILNPFRGYGEDQRNIVDPDLEETIKEFSTLDGAFVIRGDGIIESCGVFLKVTGRDAAELPRGLGTRHHAAAGITAMTHAVAVTVSESSGTVMVFHGGKVLTEIEPGCVRPRAVEEL